MNKSYKNMTVLTIFAGFMIFLAGYLTSFQNWLSLNYQTVESSSSSVQQWLPPQSTGIRQIIGTRPNLSTSEELSLHQDTQTSGNDSLKTINPERSGYPLQNVFDGNQDRLTADLDSGFYPVDNVEETGQPADIDLPLLIEMDNELIVEFPPGYSRHEMQRALSRLMVLPEGFSVNDLIHTRVLDTSLKPSYYPRIENQYQRAVRYPAQAYRYAEFLLDNHSQTIYQGSQNTVSVNIPLRQFYLPDKLKTYSAWVDKFADQYQIDNELVYAIIEVESAFNPRAVSRSRALGLMQIKPGSAGRDVFQYMDNKPGQPSDELLFNPQENIRIGVAYLSLLKKMYFKDVRDADKKELLAVASYNGGLNTVLKLFGKTPEQAVKRINRLSKDRIYWLLNQKHESEETRQYVEKVLAKRKKYQKLLEVAA